MSEVIGGVSSGSPKNKGIEASYSIKIKNSKERKFSNSRKKIFF